MWIGTSAGLYLLDKESGRFQYVALQEEMTYINTLYQAEDLSLYIGTNGSGVVVYNAKDNTFKHYHKDNCALISNNIYTILPRVGRAYPDEYRKRNQAVSTLRRRHSTTGPKSKG